MTDQEKLQQILSIAQRVVRNARIRPSVEQLEIERIQAGEERVKIIKNEQNKPNVKASVATEYDGSAARGYGIKNGRRKGD